LRLSREALERRGFRVVDVDRGGDVTYHGPGQLVGYPIFNLNRRGRDLHLYLRNLEDALIYALQPFGVAGSRRAPYTGVWVRSRKVAAIGIKVSHWVTSHGFALNVCSDLSDFEYIVPCGIRSSGVTSVSREIGGNLGVGESIPAVLDGLQRMFGAACELNQLDYRGFCEDSQQILCGAIDALEMGVIDYRPLSGGRVPPGQWPQN
jgi:lipoate-protein ligase B